MPPSDNNSSDNMYDILVHSAQSFPGLHLALDFLQYLPQSKVWFAPFFLLNNNLL